MYETEENREQRLLMKKLLLISFALSLVFTLCIPIGVLAKENNSETLWLDSYVNLSIPADTWDEHLAEIPRTTSQIVLESGRHYMIIISGTYARWPDEAWTTPFAESSPMFPSPTGQNGSVGEDAEFLFAIPDGYPITPLPEVPTPTGAILITLDGGSSWLNKVDCRPNDNYRGGHTYNYVVEGQGEPFVAYFLDSNYIDNYGMLKIKIHSLGH